jgi:lipopolysaccharide/colanic/teichoic acid biosynthesis glycosyltransferase/glycosyltransferase involved in cell wall biosynthesis
LTCIRALQNQGDFDDEYEIIFVDDASVDQTRSLVETTGVKVLSHDQKRGAAAARNSGIQAARGEVVCFTDADCEPASDWLLNIVAPLKQPDITGCKGVYATTQEELVARFVQIEYEDKYDLLRTQSRIDFVDTYSAAYRKSVLLANNGFDERIHYVEDQELSFRLAARGYVMVFQPTAKVYHTHSDSLAKYFRKKLMIGFWKAQIIRRFPERAIKDSHTPQVLKLQMLLVAAILASAALTLVASWIAPLFIILLSLFLLTTVPFVHKAWPKDWPVALLAPFLLAVRALALGLGYSMGTVKPLSGISGEEKTIGGLNYVVKRIVDICGGVVGLLITCLIAPPIALAIRLNSPGPVIFKQERIGKGGKPFTVYKFRSMSADAEERLSQLLDIHALPEPAYKLKDDPRLTRVGIFLRRWSLDEAPQFWNVLKGDMSLVGPRPEETWVVANYTDWHRQRLAVKPGLTGPMQVNGRADLPLDARVRLELDYIERYSLWRDLVLLARTVPSVMKGIGAR